MKIQGIVVEYKSEPGYPRVCLGALNVLDWLLGFNQDSSYNTDIHIGEAQFGSGK